MSNALERAAEHITAAQRALDDARETVPTEDWHAAYRRLEREHAALRTQYDADMKLWHEFKRWWMQTLESGRRDELWVAKDAPVARDALEMVCATGGMASTPLETERIQGGTSDPLTPRRRNRQAIREHRLRVQSAMRSDPNILKRHGRYATGGTARKAPHSTDTHAETVRGNARRQMHADDCPCCTQVSSS